jgi:hypothetical protein
MSPFSRACLDVDFAVPEEEFDPRFVSLVRELPRAGTRRPRFQAMLAKNHFNTELFRRGKVFNDINLNHRKPVSSSAARRRSMKVVGPPAFHLGGFPSLVEG